jgi:D-alanyl-lipoteichoic acid acyltransferase DltB (MBOAT superfamily)
METQRRAIRLIANGLFKIAVFSQPMLLLLLGLTTVIEQKNASDFSYFMLISLVAGFYFHFLYINFASFSEVMIGAGKFIGVTVPENFDRPFSTKGFLEFWSHWHLSVSHWFRDMMFTPIVKFFVMRGVRSNTLCSGIAYMTTFSVLGLWHGRAWPFLLCGFMLALGALVNQLYRDFFKRKKPKDHVARTGERTILYVSRGFTYFYICLAILGLLLPADVIQIYWLGWIGGWQALVAAAVTVTLYAIAIYGVDNIYAGLSAYRGVFWHMWQSSSIWWSLAKITIAVLVWIWLSIESEGAFVYEGF